MTTTCTSKAWFITGASSGFGLAFARYALERGDCVIATARTPARLDSLVALAPKRVLVLQLDVTQARDADDAVQAGMQRFGRIDFLINNAGYGIVGAFEETPDEELRAQFETNFFGAVHVTKAVLPTMRKQRTGAVINISSMGGQMSFAGFSAYSASKFALEGMSEALAQEVASFGIKVLIVEPGAFRTGFASSDTLKQMPVIEDYKDIVGATRQFTKEMNNTQAGDPNKVPPAVAAAIESNNTPLRLQLGADAVSAVRAHSEQLLDDMAVWEEVALATTFV